VSYKGARTTLSAEWRHDGVVCELFRIGYVFKCKNRDIQTDRIRTMATDAHVAGMPEIVNSEFERWLEIKNKRREQASMESFATEKTRANSEPFFGLNAARLITALGGTRPFG
jgi:hypothetical protein